MAHKHDEAGGGHSGGALVVGFFSDSLFVVPEPKPTREQCGACGLLTHCMTPKMSVQGQGRAGVMLVADGIDGAGDHSGQTWGGDTGRTLRGLVRRAGLDWDYDIWVTSALACRGAATGNRVRNCRPLLLKRITELQPTVIVLLGQYAMQAVVAESFQTESTGTIDEWIGLQIPSREPAAWLTPTYNPAHFDPRNKMRARFFEQQFLAALELRHKPLPEARDYNATVHIERDHRRAAALIRDITRSGVSTAFDYETNMLKPDNPERKIHTVSICVGGEWTLACPFTGDVVAALGEYLLSPGYKFASNQKFEDRWTRAVYGHPVNGLAWCTMNMAHVIDNRPGFTSIKTQSYIHLGWPMYDGHIHKFFAESTNPNDINGIAKIDTDQLLLYNGIDSALEYDVALIQMAILDHPLRHLI